jgi:uncharacterized protein (TIGR00251 family)
VATISIKVVPGSRQDRVAGRYGNGFKIQVSAPPEAGKANQAVVELITRTLGVKPKCVTIIRGHGQPRKVIQIDGLDQATVESILAEPA